MLPYIETWPLCRMHASKDTAPSYTSHPIDKAGSRVIMLSFPSPF